MEDYQKRVITSNLSELITTTKCNTNFTSILRKYDVISQNDEEEVQAEKTSCSKSSKLYNLLMSRKDSYGILCKALLETKQSGALEILKDSKHKVGSIQYDTKDLVGQGSSYTTIYRGTCGERNVAVKVFRLTNDAMVTGENSMKEVEFMKQLEDNKNVVRYFCAEQQRDTVYIAMELCRTNLHDWVFNKDGKVKKDVKIENEDVCRQALRGVAHIHKTNIIHRDLKPANVLLTNHGVVKIADFGLSKRIRVGASSASVLSLKHGTEGWMAPEVLQIAHDGVNLKMTTASDIFSLGCIFYFVFTEGSHPFGKPVHREAHIYDGKPDFPNKDLVPQNSMEIINQMILRNPSKRPTAPDLLKNKCFTRHWKLKSFQMTREPPTSSSLLHGSNITRLPVATNSQNIVIKGQTINKNEKFQGPKSKEFSDSEQEEKKSQDVEFFMNLSKYGNTKSTWNNFKQYPEIVLHYIPRTLYLTEQLHLDFLKVTSSDIFVMEGISRYSLAVLVGPENVCTSKTQVQRLSARFIILDCDNDFDKIVKTVEHPVHRIMYQEDRFYWKYTIGSSKFIKNFLLENVELVTERNLVKTYMSKFTASPFLICGDLGIGKSTLLASLCLQARNVYTNRHVIFLNFFKIVQYLKDFDGNINEKIVKAALTLSTDESKRDSLMAEFDIKNCFEIFLDGFEAISANLFGIAECFLKFSLQIHNVRLHMTIRPEMRKTLEHILGKPCICVSPFSKEQQHAFLSRIWENETNVRNREKLAKFAKMLLESLESIVNPTYLDQDYTGFPSYCLMIAQMWKHDATNYLVQPYETYQRELGVTSLFDMYSKYMEFLVHSIDDKNKENAKLHCWTAALHLLFQDNPVAVTMRNILRNKKNAYTESTLPDALQSSFTNKTFLEYIVAEFIVKKLIGNPLEESKLAWLFLSSTVLATNYLDMGCLREYSIDYFTQVIEASDFWTNKNKRQEYSRLHRILLSHTVTPIPPQENFLTLIISRWCNLNNGKATFHALVDALTALGWSQVVDDLIKTNHDTNITLKHPKICYFVNELLEKTDNISVSMFAKQSVTDEINLFDLDIKEVRSLILLFAELGYKHLLELVIWVCKHIYTQKSFYNIDFCYEILNRALFSGDVKTFQNCVFLVKEISPGRLTNFFDSRKTGNNYRHYKQTPLHKAISQGQYDLVEFLIHNYYDESVNSIPGLHYTCLLPSYQNSDRTVNNKVKILSFLKSRNYNFDFKTLNESLPKQINVKLFTVICDLLRYLPSKFDCKFMNDAVVRHFNTDSDMDTFINWMLSKNLAPLLTNFKCTGQDLLYHCSIMDVMSPETLCKVYFASPFDLTKLFASILCSKRSMSLVTTIIQLSNHKNLTDERNQTLLHHAAYSRMHNIMHYLLSLGADVNLADCDGFTPLHNVLSFTECTLTFNLVHDCVKLLVDNNADLSVKNKVGQTPFEVAKQNQRLMCIEDRTINLLFV